MNVVERLIAALQPDDVVIGGANVKKLKELPPGCRAGDNASASIGGFRLWEQPRERKPSSAGRNPLEERRPEGNRHGQLVSHRSPGMEGSQLAL